MTLAYDETEGSIIACVVLLAAQLFSIPLHLAWVLPSLMGQKQNQNHVCLPWIAMRQLPQ
jgi:hypothetical protein